MTGRRLGAPGLPAAIFVGLLAGIAAGCAPRPDHARLCGLTVGAFARGEVGATRSETVEDGGVRVHWLEPDGEHWVECGFAEGQGGSRRDLMDRVATDRDGWLTPMELFWLDRWMRLRVDISGGAPRSAERASSGFPHALYLLQQILNALTLGCIYALLANGYALIHRIVGRFNLAFGDMAMVGAVVTVIATVAAGTAGLAILPSLAAGLAVAVVAGAAAGLACEALIFRPLRRSAPQIPLIASIGLALVLAEGVRLLQGAGDLWVQAGLSQVVTLVGAEAFDVSTTMRQLVLVSGTAVAVAGVVLIVGATRFGLRYRAVSQDPEAAALMGIDGGRVRYGAFALAGACAGLAGFVVVAQYGVANFSMGLMLGFKALTAAVAGGLGSVAGATVGGFMIAMLETLWSAYFGVAYKDVAVFALLCLVLMVRPQGVAAPVVRT